MNTTDNRISTRSTDSTPIAAPTATSGGCEAMVFYRSYMEGIELMPLECQNELYKAIVCYGITGELPEGLSDLARGVMTFLLPSIDAGKRRSACRRIGAPMGNSNNPNGRRGKTPAASPTVQAAAEPKPQPIPEPIPEPVEEPVAEPVAEPVEQPVEQPDVTEEPERSPMFTPVRPPRAVQPAERAAASAGKGFCVCLNMQGDEFLEFFFGGTRGREEAERHAAEIGATPEQYRKMAVRIVGEWTSARKGHDTYTQAAEHLVNAIRYKWRQEAPAREAAERRREAERQRELRAEERRREREQMYATPRVDMNRVNSMIKDFFAEHPC